MSGGSLNYLYLREVSEGISRVHVEEAASECRRVGGVYAAEQVAELALLLRQVDAQMLELRDLLRAAEWCSSGDTSDEDLAETCAEFERAALLCTAPGPNGGFA